MNKLLNYLTPIFLGVILLLQLFGGGESLGGTTNYQSLDLQPEVAADNALVVRNNSGTAQLTVTGAGVTTFAGATTLSSTLTVSGETQLSTLVEGGSVATGLIATSTLTAAQVCDNSMIRLDAGWGAGDTTATTTLPSATALFADCLNTNGDFKFLLFENAAAAAASTTIITAGASTTLVGPGTGDDLINGQNWALLKFYRRADQNAGALIVTTEEILDAD